MVSPEVGGTVDCSEIVVVGILRARLGGLLVIETFSSSEELTVGERVGTALALSTVGE